MGGTVTDASRASFLQLPQSGCVQARAGNSEGDVADAASACGRHWDTGKSHFLMLIPMASCVTRNAPMVYVIVGRMTFARLLQFSFVEATLVLMNVIRHPFPVPFIRSRAFVVSISFESDCADRR